MSFEVTGKLHKVFETESKTATFQAREFVLMIEDGKYPQHIKFQLTQDRCQIIDPYEEGQVVKVYFDLRGREWNGKYFTNLNAWKLEQATDEGNTAPVTDETPVFQDEQEMQAEDFDDLPF